MTAAIIFLGILTITSSIGWLICRIQNHSAERTIDTFREICTQNSATILSLQQKIDKLEEENDSMREKKPHHKSKVVITCEVETSYDQKPEHKCSLLLRAASMYDKNYKIEVSDLGPVERNS